ncbi:hypothetical protein PBY51_001223 [Eleginops maclovinus]|uniref:Uncharacterized protein n=1 Tax=Eleginops maclovinus TaxID=56733 RepID=A0AAN8APY7_ELEMC|nr:hypothetical protein PBY51_001223 [Eleginops maclovinus]
MLSLRGGGDKPSLREETLRKKLPEDPGGGVQRETERERGLTEVRFNGALNVPRRGGGVQVCEEQQRGGPGGDEKEQQDTNRGQRSRTEQGKRHQKKRGVDLGRRGSREVKGSGELDRKRSQERKKRK